MARAGPRGDRAPDADGHDPGYLRLAEPISYVSATVTKMLETAVPIGSPPADLTDTDVLAVLNQHTVKDAQSALSAARRQRIAEYVGLGDRPPETRGAIATRLGITPQAVSEAVRLGAEAIKNSAALGALDEDAVDYRNPEACTVAPRPDGRMTAKAKKPAHSKREERDARDAAWLADHEDNPDPHIYLRDFKCSLLTAKRHLKALDVFCVQGCWQVKGKVLTPEVAAAQARVDHLLDDHVGRREHIQLIDRHTLLIPCEADSCCFADIAKTLRSAWSPIVIMAGWNYRGVDAYVDPDRAEELLNRLRAGKK